jgi:hypothetical protein
MKGHEGMMARRHEVSRQGAASLCLRACMRKCVRDFTSCLRALVPPCLLILAGCAATPENAGESADARNSNLGAQSFRATGLEIRQWVIAGDGAGAALTDLLRRYRSGDPPETEALERLRRNGFRIVRVRADELDAIAGETQGLTHDRSGWHGQMHEWRELHGVGLGSGGIAVAIDGRVRRFDRGSLRLMSRAWIVPMEDGPQLSIDLVSQHHSPARAQYRRLLGQRGTGGGGDFGDAAVPSIHASLLLEDGYAYILVPESPAAQWDRDGDGDAPRAEGARRSGPEIEMPRTIGEVVLGGPPGVRSSRGVLIFVPHIAPELFPAEIRAANAMDAAVRRSAR